MNYLPVGYLPAAYFATGYFPASTSDISIALTGLSVSAAQGGLSVVSAVALTGQHLTVGQGTVTSPGQILPALDSITYGGYLG